MQKGRLGRFSEHAGCNASERRAGLEKHDAESAPPLFREGCQRPGTLVGLATNESPVASAGVSVAVCVQDERRSSTGSPVGGAHAPTGKPRGPAWAGRAAEGPGVPRKRSNARRGKGPQFERDGRRRKGRWKLA